MPTTYIHPVGQPGGQTQDYPLSAPASSSSEKYTPQIYHGVGRACVLVSLRRNLSVFSIHC